MSKSQTGLATVLASAIDYRVKMLPLSELRLNPHNVRTHSKRQISQLTKSIKTFGWTAPILVDENNMLLAGHARVEAAKQLGIKAVPVICVDHLTPAQKRAYILADNKIAQNSGWDRERLFDELKELRLILADDSLELDITGFETAELDTIFQDFQLETKVSSETLPALPVVPVTALHDLWTAGEHRILCGDARDETTYQRLMNGSNAFMMFTDPPYNVRISGHVGGRGKTKHREFAAASGEMSKPEFTRFLQQCLELSAKFCVPGSIHYVCMDWRHMGELVDAGQAVYDELKNVCIWVKTNAGQGSFYRSQHELVFVFKKGVAEHLNTFELGQHGRTRTNVWTYPGVNSFRSGRMDELQMHPTVKPTSLVVDAMKDCSKRGSIVLDPFLGSGTTVIAAEQIGRRAFGIELDPAYVDVTIERWQRITKRDAILDGTSLTFNELRANPELRFSSDAKKPRARRRGAR